MSTAQELREKAQRSIDAGVEFTYDARLILAALDELQEDAFTLVDKGDELGAWMVENCWPIEPCLLALERIWRTHNEARTRNRRWKSAAWLAQVEEEVEVLEPREVTENA